MTIQIITSRKLAPQRAMAEKKKSLLSAVVVKKQQQCVRNTTAKHADYNLKGITELLNERGA